jgi:hypothetical protein
MSDFLDMSKNLGAEELVDFMNCIKGDPKAFLPPWYPDVQEIYFTLHLNSHWVAVQASLVNYKMTIYNSDISANTDDAMKKVIGPICQYFPMLLKKSRKFTKHRPPTAFGWQRCKSDEVPQQVGRY